MKNKFMEKNPDKWKKYITKWRAENKDKIKAYQKKNKGKFKFYYSEWLKKNREKMRLLQANWYQKNKLRAKLNNKRYLLENKEKLNVRRKIWREKYPERVVRDLKKKGILIKLPCKICNNPKTEAHHEDYTKPHKVIWLCKLHHSIADRKRRIYENNNKEKK